MSQSSNTFVRFEKIDKSYDGKELVVKNLNLDIAEGEFLTLLGPSGSGKTTTLMMLAGFENPTSGEIYLDKKPISSITPHKRGIGMVFQNYALFPHMTVYENLAFPLRVRKIQNDEIENKINKALDMVSLTNFENRMPNQLSGGQQQRVAVARALINQPSIIFADEPSGNLDSENANSLHKLFFDIRDKFGTTFVIVTHNEELAEMADRKILLKDGEIIS